MMRAIIAVVLMWAAVLFLVGVASYAIVETLGGPW